MSTETYLTTITDETGDSHAYAYGSLKLTTAAVREGLAGIKDAEGEFTARVVEVEAIGDETPKRVVASVTGDADVVTFVVKKKLAAERKARGAGDGDDAE